MCENRAALSIRSTLSNFSKVGKFAEPVKPRVRMASKNTNSGLGEGRRGGGGRIKKKRGGPLTLEPTSPKASNADRYPPGYARWLPKTKRVRREIRTEKAIWFIRDRKRGGSKGGSTFRKDQQGVVTSRRCRFCNQTKAKQSYTPQPLCSLQQGKRRRDQKLKKAKIGEQRSRFSATNQLPK